VLRGAGTGCDEGKHGGAVGRGHGNPALAGLDAGIEATKPSLSGRIQASIGRERTPGPRGSGWGQRGGPKLRRGEMRSLRSGHVITEPGTLPVRSAPLERHA
jgi:hypothetical protein